MVVQQEAEKSVNAVEDGLMDETEMEAIESTGLTGGSAGESLQHSGVFEQVVLDDGDDAHSTPRKRACDHTELMYAL